MNFFQKNFVKEQIKIFSLGFLVFSILCIVNTNSYGTQNKISNGKIVSLFSDRYSDLMVKNALYYADNEMPLHAISLSLLNADQMPNLYYQRSLMVIIDQLLKMKMYNTAFYYFEKLHAQKQNLITDELRLFFAKYAYFQKDLKLTQSFLEAVNFNNLKQKDYDFGIYLLTQTYLKLNDFDKAKQIFHKMSDESFYYPLSLYNLALTDLIHSTKNSSNPYLDKLFALKDSDELKTNYLNERLLIAQSIIYLDKSIPFMKEKMWDIRQESEVSEIGKLQLARILIKDNDYSNAKNLLDAISRKPENILIYYQSQLLIAQIDEKQNKRKSSVIVLNNLKEKIKHDINALQLTEYPSIFSKIKNPCDITSNTEKINSAMTGYQENNIKNLVTLHCELSRMMLFDQEIHNKFSIIEMELNEKLIKKDQNINKTSFDTYRSKNQTIKNNIDKLSSNIHTFNLSNTFSTQDQKNLEKIEISKSLLNHLIENKKLNAHAGLLYRKKLDFAAGQIFWKAFQNYHEKKWLFQKSINQLKKNTAQADQGVENINLFYSKGGDVSYESSMVKISNQIVQLKTIENNKSEINHYLDREIQLIFQNEILTLKKIQALADYEMARIIDLETQ